MVGEYLRPRYSRYKNGIYAILPFVYGSYLDLFCGAGGFSHAFHMVNEATGSQIWPVAAVDYDENAIATHKLAFPDVEHKLEDVRSLDYRQFRGKIQGVVAGSPCNDFSVAGERKAFAGEYGPLIFEPVRALVEARAEWLVFENVRGFLSNVKGESYSAYDVLVRLLAKHGFTSRAFLVNFSHFQVPQARQRVLIFAARTGSRLFHDTGLVHEESALSLQAIFDHPLAPDDPLHDIKAAQFSSGVAEKAAFIKPGESIFTATDLPEHLRLNTKTKISNLYRRLRLDIPSYTLIASKIGGGGQTFLHPTEQRYVTNREMARIQSFPDSKVWCGTRRQIRTQIGMAVPPVGTANVLAQLFGFTHNPALVSYAKLVPR